MALIRTDSQNYTDIANAIRELTGDVKQYKPSEMADAIDFAIPEYGISYNEDGTVATTYGYKVAGFAGTPANLIVNISEDTKEIGDYAFYKSEMTKLTLPNGVVKIGSGAFENCDYLQVNLPDSLTEIGSHAFSFCSKFNVTSLPNNLVSIGYNAFDYTDIALSNVPDTITKIESGVFSGCDNITNFIFHKYITSIGSYVFSYCNNFTSVVFEGTPSTINERAFNNCPNLITINVPWAEGAVAGAPWGATNATINYNYVAE